jgi:tRNA-binding EMAP/Myf-like protein
MATAIKMLDDMINQLEVLVNLSSEVSSSSNISKKGVTSDDMAQKVKVEKQPSENKPKVSKQASTPSSEPTSFNINAIDLRVGVITKVTKHETADKLYCEEIDVGEEAPRPIASGLVKHYCKQYFMKQIFVYSLSISHDVYMLLQP